MKLINSAHIAKIIVYNGRLSNEYYYCQACKIFGFTLVRDGIYEKYNGRYIGQINDLENHYMVGDDVYIKPYVEIVYNIDRDDDFKYFDTYDVAVQYAKNIAETSNCKFIEL